MGESKNSWETLLRTPSSDRIFQGTESSQATDAYLSFRWDTPHANTPSSYQIQHGADSSQSTDTYFNCPSDTPHETISTYLHGAAPFTDRPLKGADSSETAASHIAFPRDTPQETISTYQTFHGASPLTYRSLQGAKSSETDDANLVFPRDTPHESSISTYRTLHGAASTQTANINLVNTMATYQNHSNTYLVKAGYYAPTKISCSEPTIYEQSTGKHFIGECLFQELNDDVMPGLGNQEVVDLLSDVIFRDLFILKKWTVQLKHCYKYQQLKIEDTSNKHVVQDVVQDIVQDIVQQDEHRSNENTTVDQDEIVDKTTRKRNIVSSKE
ncbi:hypothetical protein LOTGIDRAFT_173490 [Lottia gigantea]|uniref:Uncharacterized protein n=1 Tax=Lottia gigantea TaxID=225164 RepID=V4ARI9_LOTGI|nr:hypothetical protein LOTGIDRAFT_173490 [Lottia gigantea]ESO99832.1 hypothetical protein LOTGIDRAFT_173490 [Lottia gigantea]